MNKPAIAIIEDEIPAARLLHSMIARLRPEWDITVIPGSVEEATEWFATHPHPDLLFLDIQLARHQFATFGKVLQSYSG